MSFASCTIEGSLLNQRNFIVKYSAVQFMYILEFGLIFRSPKELSGHAQEDQPVLPTVSVAVFTAFLQCCHAGPQPGPYLFVVFVLSS